MKKLIKFIWTLVLVLVMFCVGGLIADRRQLQENVIRLHVVANSDSQSDQQIKLAVRDAVLAQIGKDEADGFSDKKAAMQYLNSNLKQIETAANDALCALGSTDRACVTLAKESFDTRSYHTFTMPAGVYDSLRITIGSGQGKNWWCVVFPSLCQPATSVGFTQAAVTSGLDDGLARTLAGDEEYEIRFFLLDCFGMLENFFYFG